jgi:putative SOS response-associated peptidase YedK
MNAKAESASTLPAFRDAYARRRCIVPVDGFFEWRAIRGARAKRPYAIAMKNGSPFGLAGLWENWKNPSTGEWEQEGTHCPRSFAPGDTCADVDE